jgi:hypothetical protein
MEQRRLPRPLERVPLDPAAVRAWALRQGYEVGERGQLPQEVCDAYVARRLGARRRLVAQGRR